jgi:integrase
MDGYEIGKVQSSRRDYTVDDANTIIPACLAQPPEVRFPVQFGAYNGCRLAEIADGTTRDLRWDEELGVWVYHFREKHRGVGQWIKTECSEREVPLHPVFGAEFAAYVDQVVAEYGHGPLFPTINIGKDGARKKAVGNKVSKFIHKLGIGLLEDGKTIDKNIAPSHSWRHYVKSYLANLDGSPVSDVVNDALTGHSKKSVADKYKHIKLPAKLAAVMLLPNPLGA